MTFVLYIQILKGLFASPLIWIGIYMIFIL